MLHQEDKMKQFLVALLATGLVASQTACLATQVVAPTRNGLTQRTTNAHIVALPVHIHADVCRNGLSETITWVPVWGLVVGILTFGIIVPMTTQFTCRTGPTQ